MAKLHYNLRDVDKAIEMCKASPKKTQSILDVWIDSAMRMDEKHSDEICNSLEQYVELGMVPKRKTLQILSAIKHMPDRLFVLLHQNFSQ